MSFCVTDSGTYWLNKVIKFGGFLTVLGGEMENPDLQVEVWLKLVTSSTRNDTGWHGDGLSFFHELEDDMSSNLTYYSNSTPLLLMYPLH
jgi:phage gp46-like protein